jgi:hypothetical protein
MVVFEGMWAVARFSLGRSAKPQAGLETNAVPRLWSSST